MLQFHGKLNPLTLGPLASVRQTPTMNRLSNTILLAMWAAMSPQRLSMRSYVFEPIVTERVGPKARPQVKRCKNNKKHKFAHLEARDR